MAAMDEQPLQLSRWSLQLQRGKELTLPPGDGEPFVLTDVFLVDPESAAGLQGVVSAYVEMGTQKILLAQLSSEVKAVELENPLVLEEDFRFYVSNADTDTDADEDDAVVVQFKGFLVSLPSYSDTESESEDGDEEAAMTSEDEEDEESDGEEDEQDEDDLGLLLFTSMILLLAFFGLLMQC